MSQAGNNRFAVIGVGCIGSAVGIVLAANRYDVAFIGRNSPSFNALQKKNSLSLTPPESDASPITVTEPFLTSDPQVGLEGRNTIFVATKRTANATVAEVVAKHAMQGALVIMLQNGLNAAEEFENLLNKVGRHDLLLLDSKLVYIYYS